METIKNLLRPGHKEDDQTLYDKQSGEGSHLAGASGSSNVGGQTHASNDPAHTSGQGSHLASSTGGQYPINSGVDQSNTTTRGPAGQREYDPSGSATTKGLSSALHGHDSNNRTLDPSTSGDPSAQGVGSDTSKSTASHNLGSSSNTHSGSTAAAGHKSDTLNRLDPRVDSDNSRSTQSGVVGATGVSDTYGSSQRNVTSGDPDNQSRTLDSSDPRVSNNSAQYGNTGETAGYSSTTGGSFHTGPTGSAVGGHSTRAAALLDPNLDQSSTTRQENAIEHDQKHGGGAEKADHDHNSTPKVVGAGAVGLGALGLGSSSNESRFTNQGSSEVQREGHSLMDSSATRSTASGSHTGHTGTSHHQTSQLPDRTRGNDQYVATGNEREHNYGRDAAIGGGLASGAAIASNHHDNTATQPSTGSTIGDKLHGTDRNRGVGGTSQEQSTLDRSHDIMTGGASTGSQNQESHTGRNAALGAGALGAAGAGYGASRHHDNQGSLDTTSRATGGLGSTTTGSDHLHGDSHPISTQHTQTGVPLGGNTTSGSTGVNSTEPRVDSEPHSQKDHSYGRDAALVGGAGAAGYGASKLHDNSTRGNVSDSTQDAHSSDLSNRGVDNGRVGQTSTTTTTTTNTASTTTAPHHTGDHADHTKEKDSHLGRNAVLAGGAGTAAYAAHERNDEDETEKMRRLGDEERAKQAREHEKFIEKEQEDADKYSHDKNDKSLFSSLLHRDKSKETGDDHHGGSRSRSGSNAAKDTVGTHGEHEPTTRQRSGSTLARLLHGDRATGIVGDTGFPHGGAPDTHINQVSGQEFGSSTLHGSSTIGTDPTRSSSISSGPTSGHDSQTARKASIGEKLHGERATGVPGESGFPHKSEGSTGLTGTTAHETGTTTETGSEPLTEPHNERHRLHKDPPIEHATERY